jgi:hypothetical protein
MAYISNTDSSILPYNDDDMKYDIDRQMYVLTESGILRHTGYNIQEMTGNETQSLIARYRISSDVYNFLRRNSRLNTIKYKIRQIAKDEFTRQLFKEALIEQALYYIESGAGSIKTQHGINISGGKAMSLMDLRGNVLISANSEMLLSHAGLLYSGYMYYTNYEEDGTW